MAVFEAVLDLLEIFFKQIVTEQDAQWSGQTEHAVIQRSSLAGFDNKVTAESLKEQDGTEGDGQGLLWLADALKSKVHQEAEWKKEDMENGVVKICRPLIQ